jgi:hypothetical protein
MASSSGRTDTAILQMLKLNNTGKLLVWQNTTFHQ